MTPLIKITIGPELSATSLISYLFLSRHAQSTGVERCIDARKKMRNEREHGQPKLLNNSQLSPVKPNMPPQGDSLCQPNSSGVLVQAAPLLGESHLCSSWGWRWHIVVCLFGKDRPCGSLPKDVRGRKEIMSRRGRAKRTVSAVRCDSAAVCHTAIDGGVRGMGVALTLASSKREKSVKGCSHEHQSSTCSFVRRGSLIATVWRR
jgi:hypothetical protein